MNEATLFYIVISIPFVLGYLYYVYLRDPSEEEQWYLEHVDQSDFGKKYWENYGQSPRSRIRYIQKHYPERWTQAIQVKKEYDEFQKNEEYKRKKKTIKKRVLAYDYEEDLYKFFSQYAINQHGRYVCHKGVEKEELVQYFMQCRNWEEEETEKIIDNLKAHDILQGGVFDYHLGEILNGSYTEDWAIVSDKDLNFHKWMIANGFKELKNK